MAVRRGQWPVLAVNSTVAATVLVLVAVLALVVNPPAPPGIAAFAPQASKPITKAPPGQSAEFGDGQGACGRGQVCATPSATPTTPAPPSASPTPTDPPRGVPPGLQCYTWPDGTVTQTFDPQSPPCVSTWDDRKGNGGATWQGVTDREVLVVWPENQVAKSDTVQPIVDFFNTRFQLYGRKIRLVPYASQQATKQYGGTGFNDPALQRADAAAAIQLKPFAAADFVDPLPGSWSLPSYRDALSKAKVLSLSGGEVPPFGTAAGMAAKAPYQWTYVPTLDATMHATATMTCRQLAGRKAQYSQGGDAVSGRTADKVRKLAVVLPEQQFIGGDMPGLAGLLRTLEGCGQRGLKVVRYDPNDGNKTAALTASMQQLRDDGVTSVVFVPFTGAANPYSPMKAADRAGFYPEWVTVAWSKYNVDYQLNGPARQTKATFGVGTWNKTPQPELEFWYQAYITAGGNPAAVINHGRALYNELLLLASGIQMAGPKLTPETFAAGLRATTFPNPGAGTGPHYQAHVGFEPQDVTMVDDFNQFWLDTRTSASGVATSKNLNNYQAECYALLGRRFTAETWPANDSYYRGACR